MQLRGVIVELMGGRQHDIEDYGIVGNLETCALIAADGSIDWLCFPYLESPSVFAAILDEEKGGFFRISPAGEFKTVQSYVESTNVLTTLFTTASGSARLIDFMPVEDSAVRGPLRALYRKIEAVSGEMELDLRFAPRPDYGRAAAGLAQERDGVSSRWGGGVLTLRAAVPLRVAGDEAQATFTMRRGDEVWFSLEYGDGPSVGGPDNARLLEEVIDYWRGWAHRCERTTCVIEEPWHDLVVRSGLALKLLANPHTGAIAAAATTSLPEAIGGTRNWDYRYAWIRDASFTDQALFHLGHRKEARAFREWAMRIVEEAGFPERIRILYGLHGEADLQERPLGHLAGYRNSRPVRIGNGAVLQTQLDIFGELLNAFYDTTRRGEDFPEKRWPLAAGIVNYVCEVWNREDAGIWEVRGGPRHFVYSKLMCWVAVDRGLRIAREKGFHAQFSRWERTKEEIRRAILEKGYSKKTGSFVQSFGSETLDAADLLIPAVGFLPAGDERVQSTIDAVLKRLVVNGCLVRRYEGDDGLSGREGAFLICSFWLVKALALSGRIEEAERIFGDVLRHASPLGLLSEEIDLQTGRLIGNFPQAFSHIGLINSALYLAWAKDRPGAPALQGTAESRRLS
jgi:GH15 family glucan-1,4-alpha-glucosidase